VGNMRAFAAAALDLLLLVTDPEGVR